MSKLSNVRRIVAEDFKPEHREIAEKVGTILNQFMEEVYTSYQKGLNFENFNQELTRITVKTDADGIPTTSTKFSSNLRRISGIIVIQARNQTSSTVFPTEGIFVSYDQNSAGLYTVRHITGIPVGNKFELTLMLIGAD